LLFLPPHPNGFGFPASAACSTKLEYLILNHRFRREPRVFGPERSD
jgi:hypothetical protein